MRIYNIDFMNFVKKSLMGKKTREEIEASKKVKVLLLFM